MRTVIVALAALAASPALAQDSDRASARSFEEDIVREVTRGYYLKANIGSTQYLATYGGGLMRPVMAMSLGLGSDVIDRERMSAAWEVQFAQALHNGPKEDQLGALPPNALVQGDIHTFSGTVAGELSGYVSRRFGIGGRVGGGIVLIPLLMHPDRYNSDIVPLWSIPAPVHEGPLVTVFGGPTIEYYTKLSHFSIGADVDVSFTIGLDLGLSSSGYLKYTF